MYGRCFDCYHPLWLEKGYVNVSCICGGQLAKLPGFAGGHYSPQHDGGIHIETTTTRVACNGSILELVLSNILRSSVLNPTGWL